MDMGGDEVSGRENVDSKSTPMEDIEQSAVDGECGKNS
jgi:hypothetical protein